MQKLLESKECETPCLWEKKAERRRAAFDVVRQKCRDDDATRELSELSLDHTERSRQTRSRQTACDISFLARRTVSWTHANRHLGSTTSFLMY